MLVSRGSRGPQSSAPQSSASRPQRPLSRQAKSISHTGPRLQRSAGALVAARDEDVRPRIAPALAAHDELHGGMHGRGLILRKRAFGGAASENQLASSGACFRWGHDRSEGGPERAWRASGSPTAASRHLLPLVDHFRASDPHLRETLSWYKAFTGVPLPGSSEADPHGQVDIAKQNEAFDVIARRFRAYTDGRAAR